MSFVSSRRTAAKTAAAVVAAAALGFVTIGTAAPASAAVTATVTVTAPTAVAPGQPYDVTVDVVCPNSDFGTGSITADVSVASTSFGQTTDPNFETTNAALGTNPHHWAVTYSFTAPDSATLAATLPSANSMDVVTTLTGRPCVNDAIGVVKTNTIIVADVPTAPTITSTSPGNGQASVSFTPVADPVNAPVLRYEYSANGAAAVSIGTSNPFTATGLINETSNSITVRAVNAAGPGPWSAAANVTTVGPPSVPTNLAVTPGDKTVSITFSAPPTPINAIDAFQYSTDGGTSWRNMPSLSTAYDITALSTNGTTALTNGTAYLVMVRAHNSLGYGPATAGISATPSSLPAAPDSLAVTSGNGSLSVSFTPPANGGSAITDYLYSTDLGATFVSAGTTTLPLSITTTSDTSAALTNGTSYLVEIEAVNANGAGAPSTPIAAIPGVAPDKPVLAFSVPSSGTVTVLATLTSDGGITVSQAECQLDGGPSTPAQVLSADASSVVFNIVGLTNGQAHTFICRVANSAGWSPWSDPATGTAADVPAAPVLNSVVPGDTTLTVNFTPGANNGAPITSYTIYQDGLVYSDPVTSATTFTGSPVVMTGLSNTNTYSITVTATNDAGTSIDSNAISATVGQTLVTVNASSPANITYGASIPPVTWSTSPSTTTANWSTTPTCGVYGTGDTSFSNPLTGVHSAGSYVTHCSGGVSTQYYPNTFTDGTLTIAKAPATNVITCPASVVYSGTAQTPCTAAVTGVGGLSTSASVVYASNINAGVGIATANSTYAGDANHNPATATQVTFTILKASSTNVITCPTSVAYSGSLLTPCTDAITGAGLSATSANITYSANTNVGTATANSTWAGDANHTGSTAIQVSFGITKANTTNVITCPASVTYTGAALTPCTDVITGAGLSATSATITYGTNTNVGTATANSTWAGDANHTGSTATQTSFGITTATSSTVITCTDPVSFTGSALTPCHATVTGAGGLNTTATVNYTTNIDAGTGHATATYAGDSNHATSTATPVTFTIAKAPATNVITCPASVVYSGTAQTPCTSAVTGVGGLSTTATVTYASNTNAGTATATSTYAGDANHNPATATQVTFTILKASSTNVITCPTSLVYSGSALQPCTDVITGAGLTGISANITYSANTNVGTATANSTWAGDANHTGSTAAQSSFTITKATSTNVITCPASVTYTGSALTPCTDVITGAGLTTTSAAITYATNTNVGTATANSTWAGDTNHTGSTATQTSFGITTATSSTVITCTDPVTYTGTALTPCHATVTGAGGLNTTTAVDYTTNVDAGTGHATASYAGDGNHSPSTAAPITFTINVATSTTVITCPASVTYDTTAQEPCTAAVTGANGLSTTASVTYTANTDAGTAHASASYAGDANHAASSGTQTFTIKKAPSTTAITCANTTYDGTAQTPCSASVTGVGGLSTTATVTYTTNTGAGTANATASFSGDSNHAASSDAATFTIEKAASTTVVTCSSPVAYTGTARTPCTAAVTGVGNLATTAVVHYTANTDAGTANATATYAGDSNHTTSSDLQTTFTITKAASTTVVTCPSPVIATGKALTPCTAAVTGIGGLNQAVRVDYVGNVTAGHASASATFAGDGNHDASTGTGSFTILAPSSVVRPVASWAAKSAARSYRTILTSAGTPTATLSSTTTSACVIKKGIVYFLASGTCTIKVNQGGLLWQTLTTAVSTANAVVAPAKIQTLTSVVFAPTTAVLSPAAKAQLNALLPTLSKASAVIIYGCAAGRGDAIKARANQRAAAVTNYLRSKGLTVLSSAGYGSTIAPIGKTPKDRVDIGIG